MSASTSAQPGALPGPLPMLEVTQQPTYAVVALWIFVVAPFIALLVAIPVAWGWGLSALDASMAVAGHRRAEAPKIHAESRGRFGRYSRAQSARDVPPAGRS